MKDVRHYTNRLIEMAENGAITWEDIGRACMNFMSEDEVKEMFEYEFNEFDEDEDDE